MGTQRFFTYAFVYLLSIVCSISIAAGNASPSLIAPAALCICVLVLNLCVPRVWPHLLQVLSLSLVLVTLWSTWSVTLQVQRTMQDYQHTSLREVWEVLADHPAQRAQLETTLEALTGKIFFAQHQFLVGGLCTVLMVAGLDLSTVLALLLVPVVSLIGLSISNRSAITFDTVWISVGAALFFLVQNFGVASFRREHFDLQYTFEELLKTAISSSQKADSILNHTLKNTMADAVGCMEVFLASNTENAEAQSLLQSIETLRRGMVTCHNRESYVQLCAGTYSSTPQTFELQPWAASLTAGRQLQLHVAAFTVETDQVLQRPWNVGGTFVGVPLVAMTCACPTSILRVSRDFDVCVNLRWGQT